MTETVHLPPDRAGHPIRGIPAETAMPQSPIHGFLRRILPGVLLAAFCVPVQASPGLDALKHFLEEIQTFEASFGQEVLDESMESLDAGRGRVWIKRPGRFRWSYDPPDAQEIVGDGELVWVYDVELEQVTVRNQREALGTTPTLLLAGGEEMVQNYTIIDIGTQGRFDWVNLVPLDEDSSFTEVRIGFEDNRLRLMELIDTLGQRTRMSFVDLKENRPIDDRTFDFLPPDGVDVIDDTAG